MGGAAWPIGAALTVSILLSLPHAGTPVSGGLSAGQSLWVRSASRQGMPVVENGAMLAPFANPSMLRAKLDPIDTPTLRYEMGAAASAGCIVSASSDDPKVATAALSPSSTLLSGNASASAVSRGNSATRGVSTHSAVLPANAPVSLLLDVACRAVGETIVRASVSLLERGAPATRDVLINEFVKCSSVAPPPPPVAPAAPGGALAGGQGAVFGAGMLPAGIALAGGCPLGCSGHGTCSEHGQCTCAFGWFGPGCENECPGGADAPCSLQVAHPPRRRAQRPPPHPPTLLPTTHPTVLSLPRSHPPHPVAVPSAIARRAAA